MSLEGTASGIILSKMLCEHCTLILQVLVFSPVVTILYLAPMGKKKNKSDRPIKSSKDAEQAYTGYPHCVFSDLSSYNLCCSSSSHFFGQQLQVTTSLGVFSLSRLASDYIGGDALDELLSKLIRSVDVAKASRGGLPEKIWMKQQFAIGVNDVTRVLERMPPAATHPGHCSSEELTCTALRRAPLVPLQLCSQQLNDSIRDVRWSISVEQKRRAVLVAADCNPKWLTKHIPTLASTRQVPILCLKDNKGSSLRLGQVVHVRTALAIGIKARDSIVNKTIGEVLKGSKLVANEQ